MQCKPSKYQESIKKRLDHKDWHLQYTKPSRVRGKKNVAMKKIISIQRYIQPNSGSPSSNKIKQKLKVRIQFLQFDTETLNSNNEKNISWFC